MRVRISERRPTLWARLFSCCLARFLACAELAKILLRMAVLKGRALWRLSLKLSIPIPSNRPYLAAETVDFVIIAPIKATLLPNLPTTLSLTTCRLLGNV